MGDGLKRARAAARATRKPAPRVEIAGQWDADGWRIIASAGRPEARVVAAGGCTLEVQLVTPKLWRAGAILGNDWRHVTPAGRAKGWAQIDKAKREACALAVRMVRERMEGDAARAEELETMFFEFGVRLAKGE